MFRRSGRSAQIHNWLVHETEPVFQDFTVVGYYFFIRYFPSCLALYTVLVATEVPRALDTILQSSLYCLGVYRISCTRSFYDVVVFPLLPS